MRLNTYINFNGQCQEALDYYQKHLGAKTQSVMKWSQMPDAEKHTPPGQADKVLHCRFTVGDTFLMAADVPQAEPMRSAYLSLNVDSNEEAERIYAALADGGSVLMAMNETFFAHRFGQVRDRFGINWMILREKPMH